MKLKDTGLLPKKNSCCICNTITIQDKSTLHWVCPQCNWCHPSLFMTGKNQLIDFVGEIEILEPLDEKKITEVVKEHFRQTPIAGDWDRTKAIFANERVLEAFAQAICQKFGVSPRAKEPRTIELNGAHIDIYKNSVIFHDHEKEECWEYEWKELYRLTEKEN